MTRFRKLCEHRVPKQHYCYLCEQQFIEAFHLERVAVFPAEQSTLRVGRYQRCKLIVRRVAVLLRKLVGRL